MGCSDKVYIGFEDFYISGEAQKHGFLKYVSMEEHKQCWNWSLKAEQLNNIIDIDSPIERTIEPYYSVCKYYFPISNGEEDAILIVYPNSYVEIDLIERPKELKFNGSIPIPPPANNKRFLVSEDKKHLFIEPFSEYNGECLGG
ncbi:MAG: hypothetical protein Kapaf2KO_00700 [Candidatus Kapaibacteriales bacterium]